MTIKDNIKKELINLLNDEENAVLKVYSNNHYIYFTTGDEFSKGKMVAQEDYLTFIQRLRDFIKTL